MATLYDLELQESNNFIHALMNDGMTPALKLMQDQIKMFEGMGEAGEAALKELKDPESDMGKNYQRLQKLQQEIKNVMQMTQMTAELAQKANQIFSQNPPSLSSLSDEDRQVIRDYWLKKKMCIVALLKKGFTYEELFS